MLPLCLKNNYRSDAIDYFQECLSLRHFINVTFICANGARLYGHHIYISQFSDVVKHTFNPFTQEAIIFLPDFKQSAVLKLLALLYSGTVDIEDEPEYEEFISLVDLLGIKHPLGDSLEMKVVDGIPEVDLTEGEVSQTLKLQDLKHLASTPKPRKKSKKDDVEARIQKMIEEKKRSEKKVKKKMATSEAESENEDDVEAKIQKLIEEKRRGETPSKGSEETEHPEEDVEERIQEMIEENEGMEAMDTADETLDDAEDLNDLPQVKCLKCELEFFDYKKLLVHLSKVHYADKFDEGFSENGGMCTICIPSRRKVFKTIASYRTHVGQVHQKVLEYLPDEYVESTRYTLDVKPTKSRKRKSAATGEETPTVKKAKMSKDIPPCILCGKESTNFNRHMCHLATHYRKEMGEMKDLWEKNDKKCHLCPQGEEYNLEKPGGFSMHLVQKHKIPLSWVPYDYAKELLKLLERSERDQVREAMGFPREEASDEVEKSVVEEDKSDEKTGDESTGEESGDFNQGHDDLPDISSESEDEAAADEEKVDEEETAEIADEDTDDAEEKGEESQVQKVKVKKEVEESIETPQKSAKKSVKKPREPKKTPRKTPPPVMMREQPQALKCIFCTDETPAKQPSMLLLHYIGAHYREAFQKTYDETDGKCNMCDDEPYFKQFCDFQMHQAWTVHKRILELLPKEEADRLSAAMPQK